MSPTFSHFIPNSNIYRKDILNRFYKTAKSPRVKWLHLRKPVVPQTCSNSYPNQGSDYVLLPSNKNVHISCRKFFLQWSLI